MSAEATISSNLHVPATGPSSTTHAVNKAYVDSTFVGVTGGTLTGLLVYNNSISPTTIAGNAYNVADWGAIVYGILTVHNGLTSNVNNYGHIASQIGYANATDTETVYSKIVGLSSSKMPYVGGDFTGTVGYSSDAHNNLTIAWTGPSSTPYVIPDVGAIGSYIRSVFDFEANPYTVMTNSTGATTTAGFSTILHIQSLQVGTAATSSPTDGSIDIAGTVLLRGLAGTEQRMLGVNISGTVTSITGTNYKVPYWYNGYLQSTSNLTVSDAQYMVSWYGGYNASIRVHAEHDGYVSKADMRAVVSNDRNAECWFRLEGVGIDNTATGWLFVNSSLTGEGVQSTIRAVAQISGSAPTDSLKVNSTGLVNLHSLNIANVTDGSAYVALLSRHTDGTIGTVAQSAFSTAAHTHAGYATTGHTHTEYAALAGATFTGAVTMRVGAGATASLTLTGFTENQYLKVGSNGLITSADISVSGYLPLAGGTMLGTLVSLNINPSANTTYSIGTAGAQYLNVYATNFVGKATQTIQNVATVEPTGYARTDNNTLSATLASGDLTVTNTASSSTFELWTGGVKLDQPTTSGVVTSAAAFTKHYFYYTSAGVLTSSTLDSAWIIRGSSNILCCIAYHDGSSILLFDERHGITMDSATHEYLHQTMGMRYASGLGGSFGAANAVNPGFTINEGEYYDEDVEFLIPVRGISSCRVLHRSTAPNNAKFTFTAIQSKLYVLGTNNLLAYDNGDAAGPTESGTSKFVAYWVFASNENSSRILSLMGQKESTSIVSARADNTYASLTLLNLPVPELKLLYRVIYKNTGANSVTFIEAEDYRSQSNVAGVAYVATAHGNLTGLSADDHRQYLLLSGIRDAGGDPATTLQTIGSPVSFTNTSITMSGIASTTSATNQYLIIKNAAGTFSYLTALTALNDTHTHSVYAALAGAAFTGAVTFSMGAGAASVTLTGFTPGNLLAATTGGLVTHISASTYSTASHTHSVYAQKSGDTFTGNVFIDTTGCGLGIGASNLGPYADSQFSIQRYNNAPLPSSTYETGLSYVLSGWGTAALPAAFGSEQVTSSYLDHGFLIRRAKVMLPPNTTDTTGGSPSHVSHWKVPGYQRALSVEHFIYNDWTSGTFGGIISEMTGVYVITGFWSDGDVVSGLVSDAGAVLSKGVHIDVRPTHVTNCYGIYQEDRDTAGGSISPAKNYLQSPLGIGTTLPTTNHLLHVVGKSRIDSNLGIGTSASSTYALSVTGTSYFSTDTHIMGKLGVGTTDTGIYQHKVEGPCGITSHLYLTYSGVYTTGLFLKVGTSGQIIAAGVDSSVTDAVVKAPTGVQTISAYGICMTGAATSSSAGFLAIGTNARSTDLLLDVRGESYFQCHRNNTLSATYVTGTDATNWLYAGTNSEALLATGAIGTDVNKLYSYIYKGNPFRLLGSIGLGATAESGDLVEDSLFLVIEQGGARPGARTSTELHKIWAVRLPLYRIAGQYTEGDQYSWIGP